MPASVTPSSPLTPTPTPTSPLTSPLPLLILTPHLPLPHVTFPHPSPPRYHTLPSHTPHLPTTTRYLPTPLTSPLPHVTLPHPSPSHSPYTHSQLPLCHLKQKNKRRKPLMNCRYVCVIMYVCVCVPVTYNCIYLFCIVLVTAPMCICA